jgi:ribosomal protein S27AE
MLNIKDYKTKEVECDRCGWVSKIAKHIPLKQAWCGRCRSSRIRLHKRLLTKRPPDGLQPGQMFNPYDLNEVAQIDKLIKRRG